ncbi:hypothetical protein T4B_3862 [Trichinella pseudospiralis]|uniref:Uncharacterized protein n=1 Tax=Trichinella pseudospiralis TaxID=6337 RepID=A0A0V0XV34_TRIPS|nr:hypothetical protein T4E_3230 [Trichinella pseudospiralis]KRY66644.1 hypothetical protein T4A_11467 [Trichinella pseudospiralis]KRZ17451.1 hypothetical protein T4B_3862 [Trichinella pseudospiralis]
MSRYHITHLQHAGKAAGFFLSLNGEQSGLTSRRQPPNLTLSFE